MIPRPPTTPPRGSPPGPGGASVSTHPFPLGLTVFCQPFTQLFTPFRPSLVLRFSGFRGQRGLLGNMIGAGQNWDESKFRPRGSPTIPWSPTTPFWGVPPGPTLFPRPPAFSPSVP